jgi:putative FmdB family regulatory protein
VPTYEYACSACGAFDALRPIVQRNDPGDCPGCGAASPRVMFTPPGLGLVTDEARRAHGVNERSAHAPRCGCSLHGAAKKTAGAKGFPGKRPWMISH